MRLPHTFYYGSRPITVDADRSITVNPGDSLSIYSHAIYGNFDHINDFSKVNQQEITNKNLIIVGEKVYHYGSLPGETCPPPEVAPPPVNGGSEVIEHGRLCSMFTGLFNTIWPVPEWSFWSSSGTDLSCSFVTGQYFNLELRHSRDLSRSHWYYGVGGGGTFGPDSAMPVGGATTQIPFIPNATFGAIFKLPTAGQSLSAEEINGTYMVLEIGAGLIFGGAATLLLFGYRMPWDVTISVMRMFLLGKTANWSPWMATGGVLMAGTNQSVGAGVALRAGVLYSDEAFF